MIKTAEEIRTDIKDDFENRISANVQDGSAIDLFTGAISSVLEDNYTEIENSRNPHVWTSLEGEYLDATGTWVNLPRRVGEGDESYRYRLMNWMLTNEASNATAINDALLNLTYSSNAEYVPKTHGTGTGTVYVIPKEYTTETITNALQEVQKNVSEIACPGEHIEYIVPAIKPVTLSIYISSENGDIAAIKSELEDEIKEYINSIPPKEYLSAGTINAIGVTKEGVDYFNVLSISVNYNQIDTLRVVQELDTKMIFDTIEWIEE